jgi:N-ethylmaleimide reductase
MNQTQHFVLADDARGSTSRDLHAPVRVGAWLLPNRVVMSPMTRQRAGAGDAATGLQAEHYAQRASAGLIVAEGSQVSPQGRGYIGTPGIHTPEQVAGWRLATGAVHAAGGRIVLQLWHVGRVSHPSLQPGGAAPVAPSALAPPGMGETPDGPRPFGTPRALETSEIPGVIGQFRDAARNALAAGFDGVELHAGNGFLIDQFLRDSSNRRTDAYGGGVPNRARFLLELAEEVAGVVGAARLGVRISPFNPWGGMSDRDPAALFGHVAGSLSGLGIAYLHVAETRTRRPMFSWTRLRRRFRGTYIANGGYDRYRASAALRRDRADLVSFGRAFIANPDLPERLRIGAPLRPADPAAYYGGGAAGYTDHSPMTQAERAAAASYDWRRAALAWAKWW